jgi:ubiquinone/menaquinone biosynthesis C-methylase UbiE
MKTYFEAYGQVALDAEETTIIAGRRLFHKKLEKKIAEEIRRKLELSKTDTLLEIGCGPGNLLDHLQNHVGSAVGIDHPNILRRAREKLGACPNIELYPGNWFDISIERTFDKILIYSVIHCLQSFNDLIYFLEKAIAVLRQGGRMLIGDIPNTNKMERFRQSNVFEIIEKEYREKASKSKQYGKIIENIFKKVDQNTLKIDDELILKLVAKFRQQGLDAYLLNQDLKLPFGYTREDILICNRHPLL